MPVWREPEISSWRASSSFRPFPRSQSALLSGEPTEAHREGVPSVKLEAPYLSVGRS